ncbi:MAG TPA: hypothetical protein VIV60_15435, partial [Polyangiaceae bacterium]
MHQHLTDWLRPAPSLENFQETFEHLSLELGQLQRQARSFGLPIIVLFEGWEAAGKGAVIQRLALTLDPRGYRVISVQPATGPELLWPPLYRFWRDLPEPGQLVLYNLSYYDRIWRALAEGDLGKRKLAAACNDICAFEHTLQQQGYLIKKFFLHITRKEQIRRFHAIQSDNSMAWRIDATDLRQHRKYDAWCRAITKVMSKTEATGNPFVVVDSCSRKSAALVVLEELRRSILAHLGRNPAPPTPSSETVVQVAEPERADASQEGFVNAPKPNLSQPNAGIFASRITSG